MNLMEWIDGLIEDILVKNGLDEMYRLVISRLRMD